MNGLPTHRKEASGKEASAMATAPSQTPASGRRKRNMWTYLAIFLGITFTAYTLLTRTRSISLDLPFVSQHQPTTYTGLDEAALSAESRKKFEHLIRLADLPSDFVPETGKHRSRHSGRLVVVGDVHGMKDALVDLLEKVKFDKKRDHLILAGDMISKGPDSKGVVDLAMKLGATGIRGNHEDRVLEEWSRMMGENVEGENEEDVEESPESGKELLDEPKEKVLGKGKDKDRSLIKHLGNQRLKWLKKCPVILRVGKLRGMGEVVVVHAGLAPGVKLERQDPYAVMNMRTIGKHGVPDEDRNGGVFWVKVRFLPGSPPPRNNH